MPRQPNSRVGFYLGAASAQACGTLASVPPLMSFANAALQGPHNTSARGAHDPVSHPLGARGRPLGRPPRVALSVDSR
eukprot:542248-Prymnesium_polylepis.2